MAQENTVRSVTVEPDRENAEPPRRPARFRDWRRGMWRRGIVLAVVALAIGLVLMLHSDIPNTVGNLGSLTETFLPWLGAAAVIVLVLALLRRSATALIAVVLPLVVWLHLFGGLLVSKQASDGDLTVATHNVDAGNLDPAATARSLVHSDVDVLALEELTPAALPYYVRGLAATYKYHTVEGTVGLWSKYPMKGTKALYMGIDWVRAMRSTIATPHGEVAVYAAHLPSVRVRLHAGFTAGQRDNSVHALGRSIAAEPLPRVLLLGDLNGTMNDRSLQGVTAQMRSTQGAAGDGYGFSWPASFPLARIDQIMVKGVEPTSSWTLPRTGSDHLPIAARVKV